MPFVNPLTNFASPISVQDNSWKYRQPLQEKAQNRENSKELSFFRQTSDKCAALFPTLLRYFSSAPTPAAELPPLQENMINKKPATVIEALPRIQHKEPSALMILNHLIMSCKEHLARAQADLRANLALDTSSDDKEEAHRCHEQHLELSPTAYFPHVKQLALAIDYYLTSKMSLEFLTMALELPIEDEAKVRRICDFSERLGKLKEACWDLAEVYYDQGLFPLATAYYTINEVFDKNSHKKPALELVQRLNTIGSYYFNKNNALLTTQYLSKSVQIRKKIFGKKHVELAEGLFRGETVRKLAQAHRTIKNTDEWVDNLGECIRIIDHLFLTGNAYRKLEEFDLAIEYYAQSLALQEQVPELFQSKKVLECLKGLAIANYKLKRFDEALAYFTELLDKMSQGNNTNTSEFADILRSIGYMYFEKKDFNLSIDYLSQALTIESEKPANLLKTFSLLHDIGYVHNEQKHYPLAIHYFEQCLTLQTNFYGEEAIELVRTLNSLGIAHNWQSSSQVAVKYFRRSLAITKAVYGAESDETINILQLLAGAYDACGNISRARNCLEQVQLHNFSLYGVEDPEVAPILQRLSLET